MAESDWTVSNDSPDANTIRRGSTQAITPPPGGSFVYAFNSAAAIEGASGLFYNGANFAPYSQGASVRGVIQKGPGGGATGSTPLLISGQQGTSVNDQAYFLCFANDDPAKILLCKGAPAGGPDAAIILAESSESFAIGDWKHLRLDVVYNSNGDVALSVYENDLDVNPLGGAFVWESIDGMATVIDDALGITTGSLPLVGGRAAMAMWCDDVTRRAYFANIEILRQVS